MFGVVVVVGWGAVVFASPQASVGQNMRRLVCVPMSSFDNICTLLTRGSPFVLVRDFVVYMNWLCITQYISECRIPQCDHLDSNLLSNHFNGENVQYIYFVKVVVCLFVYPHRLSELGYTGRVVRCDVQCVRRHNLWSVRCGIVENTP